MTTWRLRLKPLSPWATPWRADSIFGAICWRWRDLFPDTFEGMLNDFREGVPPFILSDALPGDAMPLPFHIAASGVTARKPKPPVYISADSFRSIVGGEIVTADLLQDPTVPSIRVQTSIDRQNCSAADGQLFETDIQQLAPFHDFLTVYIRTERYINQIIACIRAQSWLGFGKKSSTGLGQFDASAEPERCDWLSELTNANAWMALNHFIPAPSDPLHGRWRIEVTFPKFQGNAAANVFKGTILMLAPGSVFRALNGPPQSWYGSMISVPRPEMPKALHYALCFPVGLQWAK